MNKKYCVSSMKRMAQDRELEFVSEVYTNCDSNHAWKCRICDHEWRATPSNIKTGYGCIKCSYSHKRWETRRRKHMTKSVGEKK